MKTVKNPWLKSSGFTLIELLVVISIVALLIALLLPALEKARDQTRLVMCHSNKRGIGSALLMYAADYDGWLPPSLSQWDDDATGYLRERYWSVVLQEEGYGHWNITPLGTQEQSKILCPSGKWIYSAGGATSFGMNINPYQAININWTHPIPSRYGTSTSRTLADIMILADSFQRVLNADPDQGKQVWFFNGLGLMEAYATAYHDSTVAAWFADGHAQTLTPQELGPRHRHNVARYFDWNRLEVMRAPLK